jgi:hypothetical protein
MNPPNQYAILTLNYSTTHSHQNSNYSSIYLFPFKLFYHNINLLILCTSYIPFITHCYYIITLNPYSIYTPHIIPTQITHPPLFNPSISSILLSCIHFLTILSHSSNAKIIYLLTYYSPKNDEFY